MCYCYYVLENNNVDYVLITVVLTYKYVVNNIEGVDLIISVINIDDIHTYCASDTQAVGHGFEPRPDH